MKNYCFYCMNETPNGRFCPYCGHENIADQEPSRLRPGTILQGRYVAGSVISSDGFSVTYIGRDLTANRVVNIKEYYPNGFVSRDNHISAQVIASDGHQNDFQNGKHNFLSHAGSAQAFEENGTAYVVTDRPGSNPALSAPAPARPAPVQPAPVQTNFPQQTNAAGFAPNAGYPNYPSNQNQVPRKSKTPIIIIICIILCVSLIVGSVAYFFIQYNSFKRSQAVIPAAEPTTVSDETDETVAEKAAPTEAPAPAKQIPVVSEVTATASATLDDQEGHSYSPSNVMDNDNTCWCPKEGSGVDEWIKIDYPEVRRIDGIDIINGYAGSADQYKNNGKVKEIKIEFSDGKYATAKLNIKDTNARKTIQHLSFDPVETVSVKITILSIEKGEKWEDTCITYLSPTSD